MSYSNSSSTRRLTQSRVLKSVLMSFTLAASLGLANGSVSAASQCKGLDNAACGAQASCGWVDGYKRKDGRAVKSFCRTKAKSQKKVSKNTTKAAESGN